MTGAVRAVRADEVTSDGFSVAEVQGRRILLTRLPGGGVVAFAGTCPHQGQPLTFGEVEDGCIVCPHHRYAYDPRTGSNVFPGDEDDLTLPVYEAEERDGWVWVTLQPRRS